MKAIKVASPNNLEIVDVAEPSLKSSNGVKIKVMVSGICGSDIGIFKGSNPMAIYPRIIGHEMTGVVEEVGKDVKKITVGDHVVVDPVLSCGECQACKDNRPNICYNLQVMGVHVDGGYQEHIVVPEENVYTISKNVSWETAVLVEPFAVAANVVDRAGIKEGSVVFLMGAGNIGQTILRVAALKGAKVIISDIDEEKLEKSKKYGAVSTINSSVIDAEEEVLELTNGVGPEIVIDAVCTPQTVEQAIRVVAPGGVVMTLGFSETPSEIQQKWITAKELDVRGSRLNNRMFPRVIEWLENGELSFDEITSDIFEYSEASRAFEFVTDNTVNKEKVLLTYYKK